MRAGNPLFLPENLEKAAELITALRDVAGAYQATPSQVALAWLLRRPAVASVVIGATNEAQLQTNLKSVELSLTDQGEGMDEATLARYHFAPEASFDRAPGWLYDGMGAAFRAGTARLAIAGGNPSLLANEDSNKVGRANRAVSIAYRPALAKDGASWQCSGPPDAALAKLWDLIFATTRIGGDDPVGAWKTHDAGLQKRAKILNEKRYAALQYAV